MEKEKIFDQLQELLKKNRVKEVRKLLEDIHVADIADFMEELDRENTIKLFRFLHKDMAAEVFSHLSTNRQIGLVKIFTEDEINYLMESLYVDDATDFLEELPANAVLNILANTSVEKRKVLNKFLKYKEDSAGSVMTEEFIKVSPDITVFEAISLIRNNKSKLATSSYIYVTSLDHVLLGELSIRELLRAEDDEIIKDIMTTNIIYVDTETDQEEALNVFQKYDFMAIPVIDSEGRLVGVITADDALDISEKETDEDFMIMAAVSPDEKTYFETSVFDQAKSRLPWLMILMISGMLNGLILGGFEHAFVAIPLLVTFIPMLTDTGGNTGSQSSTLIIRGLATGDIKTKDFFKVLRKELEIAFIVGVSLGFVSFLRVIIFPPHDLLMGLVVSLSVVVIVVMAKIIGGVLPILAKKMGFDPALMAAPVITTLVDAGGLIVFFIFAKLVFKI